MGGLRVDASFDVRRDGDEVVVSSRLRELDLASAPRLLAALEAVDVRGVRTVRLDLGDVRYADTAFVAVLVVLSRLLAGPRVQLTLDPVSPAVDAILSLHRLGRPREASGSRYAGARA